MIGRNEAVTRKVETIRREGRRIILRLSCGHTKLHNPRLGTPRRAVCPECRLQDVRQ